jgi:hypothetical protein
MGKISSARMGGGTWLWEISINGGPPQVDVSLTIRQPQTQIKILNPRH